MRKQIVGLLGAASIASTMLIAGGSVASADQVSIESTAGGKISRAEVIKRADYWYKNRSKISYNGRRTYRDIEGKHQYRRDCSGFVSMALHLTPTGVGTPSTMTLNRYGKKIKRSQLHAGDYMGYFGPNSGGSNGHVRLFVRWLDSKKKRYLAYDFGSFPVKKKSYGPADDFKNGHAYSYYSYKKIF
jgi:hypothetical protein